MTSVIERPSTPPPPAGIRTPPTPRFGTYYDNYEPYSPRKSARLSSQRAAAANRTPSPASAQRLHGRSPRTDKKPTKHNTSIASPMLSPQKKRQPALDSVRRASASLTTEGNAQAAAALGIKDSHAQRPTNTSARRAAAMLPTPSKTPQKPPNEKQTANIKRVARNLFHSDDEEVMPSPKKRRPKQYTGTSLESFTAVEIEEDIKIFTDSQDRVPAKDASESNPFYGNPCASAVSPKRQSKRKVKVPGEGLQSIDKAVQREDGIVYNFRGKKFFRKFSEIKDEEEELQEDIDAHLSRPLTRGGIKPRRLFQPEKTAAMIEEEEAATDVEEQEPDLLEEESVPAPQTPAKSRNLRAVTPEAPKFEPVSPPSTRRTTRSANKLLAEAIPMKAGSRKSPFDAWPRTKEHKATSATKRHAEELTPAHAKRTRN